METINIGYGHMALGFLLLIIPTYFLYRYRTGLVKDTLIAALRMTVQLFLIGFYLEYLFLWDKLWINLLWILLMIIMSIGPLEKKIRERKLIPLHESRYYLIEEIGRAHV